MLLTNVASGFFSRGKLGSFFLELRFQLVEFCIRQGRFTFEVVLHGSEILRFLAVHVDHGRSVPGEVLFQKIEFSIVEKLPSTDVVRLNNNIKIYLLGDILDNDIIFH